MKVLIKDLDSLRRLYEPDGKTPEMVGEYSNPQTPTKGEEIEIHDGNGNSVRGNVRRCCVVVVPEWETYSAGVAKGQDSLL